MKTKKLFGVQHCPCCKTVILKPPQLKILRLAKRHTFITSKKVAELLDATCLESISCRLRRLFESGLLHRQIVHHNVYRYFLSKVGNYNVEMYHGIR